jgi:hypothetical protein
MQPDPTTPALTAGALRDALLDEFYREGVDMATLDSRIDAIIAAAQQPDERVAGLVKALKRLASWDEMAGNGDPDEFPAPYRQEVAARINLARAALAQPTAAGGAAGERCAKPGCGLESAHPFHVPGHSTYSHPFTPSDAPDAMP